MGNQQRTPNRSAPQTGNRIIVPCRTFENYTVVAFALVAEFRQTRPVQNRVPVLGVQVQVLPSARITNCLAPLGKLEKPPDLGSGVWGFDSLAGHHASLAQQSRATGS